MDIIDKILGHPKNYNVLKFLQIPSQRDGFMSDLKTPDKIPNVGRHLDVWESVWDEFGKELPQESQYMFSNNALLIHPKTGVIFVFSDGMHYMGIRQPKYRRPLFAKKNEGRKYVFNMDGIEYDLQDAGSDWIVANFIRNSEKHIQEAYYWAGKE